MPEDVVMTTETPAPQIEPVDGPSQSSAPANRKENLASMRASLPNEHGTESLPAGSSTTQAAPVNQTAEALTEEKIAKLLDARITSLQEAMRREIGQGNILPKKLQGLADKFMALEKQLQAKPQSTIPGVLASLPADQQAAYKQLVREALGLDPNYDFGKTWQDLEKEREELRTEREDRQLKKNVGGMVERARGMLGENYEKVEPYAKQAFQELLKAVDGGDEEAQKFFDELYTTRSGLIAFLNAAQYRYSQALATQSQTATAAKEKGAKAASTTLSTASRSSATVPDILSQKPSPENRKDWLKKAKATLGTVD